MNPFSEAHVRALCLLAGIEVQKVYEQSNQYWPDAYVEQRAASPWFLVKVPQGILQIGWRKRVLSISWEDTPVRALVTTDDTTKFENLVHAWSYPKAVEYLTRLASLLREPAAAPKGAA